MNSDYYIYAALIWQNTLSILWKVFTYEQVDSSDCEKVVINKIWVASKILSVTRFLLDSVLSVAASVIVTLLLTSGDVEENPGPGGSL